MIDEYPRKQNCLYKIRNFTYLTLYGNSSKNQLRTNESIKTPKEQFMKYLMSILLVLSGASAMVCSAQTAEVDSRLPVIFELGEFEVQMDNESLVHKTQLLTACDYDIELAYHIGFYLKPNSKNLDRKEFAAFLKSFVNNYSFPHTFNEPFSHYGSAGFPTAAYEVPAPAVDTSSASSGGN